MFYKDNQLFTESEIKVLNPNTSFPTPFVAPDDFVVCFDTPKPECGELQVAYQDGTEIDSKGNRVIKWSVKDMFSDYAREDGTVVTKAEQEAEYATKKLQDTAKAMEEGIETHINTTVKAKGYNSQDSIAKYLVVGNPFYDECTAISLWIGSVWVYSHQVQADVMAGTRVMPTIEELIAELPALVI